MSSSSRRCGSRSGSAAGRRPRGRRFPQLIILVTGDGQRRAEFERRFAGLPARRMQLRARWLEPEEYPLVVGSADVGLCLHRSTSGLDIPMKVADSSAPACRSWRSTTAPAWPSASGTRDNGLLFSTARQLADILFDLFEGYPGGPATSLDRLRTARADRSAHLGGRMEREAKELLDGLSPDLLSASTSAVCNLQY